MSASLLTCEPRVRRRRDGADPAIVSAASSQVKRRNSSRFACGCDSHVAEEAHVTCGGKARILGAFRLARLTPHAASALPCDRARVPLHFSSSFCRSTTHQHLLSISLPPPPPTSSPPLDILTTSTALIHCLAPVENAAALPTSLSNPSIHSSAHPACLIPYLKARHCLERDLEFAACWRLCPLARTRLPSLSARPKRHSS